MVGRNPRTNFKSMFSNIINIFHVKRRTQPATKRIGQGSQTNSMKWSQTSWGRKFMQSATLALALFCSASLALADFKITTKSTTSGQSMTSTTYIKGARQRTEGMGYTTIYQCDLKRMIQINDKTRSYLITPLDGANSGASTNLQGPGTTKRRGGVITYHTINTDTGERKEMLGLMAKHIKSKIVIETSEGACNSMNMEMETDGWYVDLPSGLSCPTDGSAASNFLDQSDCVDEVRYKTEGPAKLGQPVMTTTKIKFNAANIPTTTSTQEVIDLSTVKVDAALFEIPAGYREVKSMQELGSPY